MKSIFTLFSLTFLAILSSGNLNAQCGIGMVEAAPIPVIICEGDAAAMTFTATGSCTGGNWEFQVNQGATVVQAWSTNATFNPAPTTTTVYTVFGRCSACPGLTDQLDFTIEVLEEPTVNGTTLVCAGTSTTLTASGPSGPFEWYDAATGGNLVSASGVYTTPPLMDDATYWVSVADTSSIGGTGGSVLITECGLGGFPGSSSADYIEISNLYTTPVNTTGWVVALSQSYTNVNSTNTIIWNLPSSFSPCSILSKTDVSSQPNYWGNNILWNPGSASWAIIIDNFGNVVDFVGWGYTAAQLAAFNPTINGFSITLGAEWTGNGFNASCGTNGTGTPFSISRIGNTDNNNASDFVCQATSLNVVNPSLSCGWTANVQCRFPTTIDVDVPPTASSPATINVECIGDVPPVDLLAVTDEADDYTAVPVVSHVGDVSDGLSCPETITRTFRITDDCQNFIEVDQLIVVQDTQGPVVDPPPAGVTVECVGDIPAMTSLGFTDNCDAPGTVVGTDGPLVGGGCGGTVTRTWIATDACGNASTPVTQIFTVMDVTAPTAGSPTSMNVECVGDIPAPDGTVVPGVADNCSVPTVTHLGDASDGLSCPETITRTYAVTDDCGNQITVDRIFIVNDVTPPTASNPAAVSYALVGDVPAPDPAVVIDEADNCGAPTVTWVSDVSDNDICVGELIIRTFAVTDECGNEILVTQEIQIDPLPIPIDAGPDQTICEGSFLTLSPVNPIGAALTWSINVPSGAPFIPAGTDTYTVTASFNGCTNSDDVTVVVEEPPVVSFIADVLEGCEPLEVTFITTSTAASGIAACEWTMNGETLNGCGATTYTFPTGGTYDVTLTTTSVTGCTSTETYPSYIYVESTPVANFGVSSEQLSTIETSVDFMNTSTGAVSYEWDFDDNTGVSFAQNPSHEFPTADGGYYSVQLVAISPLGCADTTWAPISIDEELLYFIPNTFTPDGDAYNQTFQPVFTTGFDPYDFNMKIFNRWGEVVFETNDATVGWDGTYGGKLVKEGIYTWIIEFKTAFSDERKSINGHVNMMK